jgi:dGTPase
MVIWSCSYHPETEVWVLPNRESHNRGNNYRTWSYKTSSVSWTRHPLVFLTEAADDICYAIVDLEDALEVGILGFHEVESILSIGLDGTERQEYGTIASEDMPRRLNFLRGKVVDYLVSQAIRAFFDNEQIILAGDFAGDLITHCEENAREIVTRAKGLASDKVFRDARKTEIEIGAYSIIDVLLKAFCDACLELKKSQLSFRSQRVFDLLGVNAPGKNETLYSCLIRMTDFVSGSTDKFAVRLSRRLSGFDF